MKNIKNIIFLFITAVIWGCAFVSQSVAGNYIEAFTFNSIRFLMGAAVLLPLVIISLRNKEINKRLTLTAGLCCGVVLAAASVFQQWGVSMIPVGRAGFITSLYIVIVPVMGIFTGRKITLKILISVVIAVIGLYLLCIKESFALETGDIYVIVCAFLFSIHIIIVEKFSIIDGIILSFIQFAAAGIICAVFMLFTESPSLSNILAAWKPLLYSGVLSCGVGYTFQVLGQKNFNPTIASLILSLESVTSAIAGYIILGQSLTLKEVIGCAVMLCAVIIVQIPGKNS